MARKCAAAPRIVQLLSATIRLGRLLVDRPDVAIVLNGPSFIKYDPLVVPGGLLVINSSIVEQKSARKDIDTVMVPGNAIAEEMGSSKMMNMALLGAMLGPKTCS